MVAEVRPKRESRVRLRAVRKLLFGQEALTVWLFTLPSLIGFFLFHAWLAVRAAQISFTHWNLLREPRAMEFENYVTLFNDPPISERHACHRALRLQHSSANGSRPAHGCPYRPAHQVHPRARRTYSSLPYIERGCNAFQLFKIGYASALSVVLFLLLVTVTIFQMRLLRGGQSDLT